MKTYTVKFRKSWSETAKITGFTAEDAIEKIIQMTSQDYRVVIVFQDNVHGR